jgi:hypothetical protein
MKRPNVLLSLDIGGQSIFLHKTWYLFYNDISSMWYPFKVTNKDDNDEVLIGLGFKEPEEKNEYYRICWGDNLTYTHIDQYSQNVYLINEWFHG